MIYKHGIRYLACMAAALCSIGLMALTVVAQEQTEDKKAAVTEKGRDPFKRYVLVRKVKPAPTKLEPPSVEARINNYRAQKMTAAAAHVAPPKPTTALLLNEVQVTGVFRTPRGWAAMVEATPIKLSYVIYPGETFFDGQLVAIEETRLVFRRDIVWTDGRKDKSVEVKPLRQPKPVEAMTAAKTETAAATAPESTPGVGVGAAVSAPKTAASGKPSSPQKQ